MTKSNTTADKSRARSEGAALGHARGHAPGPDSAGFGHLSDRDAEYATMFAELSRIGQSGSGGVERMALSAADCESRRWLAGRMKDAGASISIDRIGNLFGLFTWSPKTPYVLVGSHLDSQQNAGIYDGSYGVVAALSAAMRIDERVRTHALVPTCNLAVVDWTNEEGARFEPSLMGSRVYTGALPYSAALAACDLEGHHMGDELVARDWRGHTHAPRASAYVEIHVEQGARLFDAGIDLGIVTGSWSAVKMDVEVRGEQSHTGCTPMDERHDALYGAALLVAAVRDLADESGGEVRTSATKLVAYPMSANTVASRCTLHIEVRAEETADARAATEKLKARFGLLEARAKVNIVIVGEKIRESAAYWNLGLGIAEQAAAEANLTSMRMKTMCGHDSVALNEILPTIMMFVPSVSGWAHSPRELTDLNDQLNGVRELTAVIERLLVL